MIPQFSFKMQLLILLIGCLFLLVSNVFSHPKNAFSNEGQSSDDGAKKVGFFFSISRDQETKDIDRFGRALKAKKYLMRCYTTRETVLAKIYRQENEITTFAIFKRDHDLVAQFARECDRKYFDVVTRALKEWGFIGDAIESWMKVMNDYFIDNGRLLSQILTIYDPRSNQDLSQKLLRTFEKIKWNSELSLDNDDHDEIRKNIKVEYLKLAYGYGEGICNRLGEYGIFHEVFGRIDVIYYKRNNLGFNDTKKTYDLLMMKYMINFWSPMPEMDLFHPMALLFSVRFICKRFRRSRWMIEDVVSDDQWNRGEIRRMAIKMQIRLAKLEVDNGISWQDRFKIKIAVDKLLELNPIQTSLEARYLKRLIEAIQLVANQYHNSAMKKSLLAQIDWKETIPHAVLAYDILDWLYHHTFDLRSIDERLSVRNATSSMKFELIFFNGKNDEDRRKRLDVWLNGTGYCDIYMAKEIQENLAVFEIMETLNDFSIIRNFSFEDTNRITQLFYMTRICQEARIIPFEDIDEIEIFE